MNGNLSHLSDEDLRNLFTDLAIKQGDAWPPADPNTIGRYDKLDFEIVDVMEELQSRPGDARRILIPLLEHENPHVRLKTATNAFALVPEQARRALQSLHESAPAPACHAAGRFLDAVDMGMYVPT